MFNKSRLIPFMVVSQAEKAVLRAKKVEIDPFFPMPFLSHFLKKRNKNKKHKSLLKRMLLKNNKVRLQIKDRNQNSRHLIISMFRLSHLSRFKNGTRCKIISETPVSIQLSSLCETSSL